MRIPLRGRTLATPVGLLASTGLRSGEAVTPCDLGQLSRCLAHADPLCFGPLAEEASGVGAR